MIDTQEQLYRQQAVSNAIATVRLEGLDVDETTVADLERFARGEIGTDEVLRHLRQRIAAGEFRDAP